MLNELPSMYLPVQYTASKSCVWETGMSTALRSTFGEIHYEDDTLSKPERFMQRRCKSVM